MKKVQKFKQKISQGIIPKIFNPSNNECRNVVEAPELNYQQSTQLLISANLQKISKNRISTNGVLIYTLMESPTIC
jgi:hypothetical protein